jgi:hypothetical protein
LARPVLEVMRAKFRETIWFKKGEQDAQVRDEAVAAGDLFAPNAVDLMPIEDRYDDDGNVRPSDSRMFGIHTGTTEYMPRLGDVGTDHEVDEHTLVRDLKRGRFKIFAAMGGAVVVIAVAVVLLV